MIESVDVIVRQPGVPERTVRLNEGATRLGRAEDNELVLSDVGVSRRHAQITVSRVEVTIEDLGSGNGTYYNGYRVQNQGLQDGDEVVIDPFVLRFAIHGQRNALADNLGHHAPARLEVVVGTGMAGSSYPIGSRGLSIGRSEDRDVVIPDPASSRHHCQIALQDGEYVLRDMGSANGVYVNAVRIRECTLADGDLVRIGNTEMRFVRYDQGVSDSTTQVVPGEVWNHAAGDPSWSGIPGQANTIVPRDLSHRRRGSRMRSMFVLALGGMFAFGILLTVAVVIIVILLVVFLPQEGPPPMVARAPSWSLDLPPGLESATANALFDQGVEKMKEADRRGALQDFYRVLEAAPENRLAEKFAFAAGELLLLDNLERQLARSVAERKARIKERDRLLRTVERGGKPARGAAETLEREFREDPVVAEALGWGDTADQKKLRETATAAADLLAKEDFAGAAVEYLEVLEGTTDPAKRKPALVQLKVCQRELAREVAQPWTTVMVDYARGVDTSARFGALATEHPTNPSLRLHAR